MRRIEPEEAKRVLLSWREAGFHVDSRLMQEIGKQGQLYVLRLEDQESYLSLIWQESDPARLLTPPGRPRTLRDVGKRFLECGHSFESLSRDLGHPRTQHHPEWFAKCLPIDADFNYSKFGWVAIVSPNDSERNQSPAGSFYLFDGMHKTLVLTKHLLKGEITYQPIGALFLVPRRG